MGPESPEMGLTNVGVVNMPLTWSCVCVCEEQLPYIHRQAKVVQDMCSQNRSFTSATIKIHLKGQRRPRFRVSEHVPNVAIED